jgi:Xaa-Pro aminopeptidase
MDPQSYLKRVSAFRKILAGTGIETAWIIQPENRRYLSGFGAGDTQFTESAGSLLIDENRLILVTDSRYALGARREAVGFEVRSSDQGIVEQVSVLVSQFGIQNLGFEEDYLTWGLHRQLAERLRKLSPPVVLSPISGLVEALREVKDDLEIKAVEASADLISGVMDEVIARLEPGLTEQEVSWQIEDLAREGGAEGLAFPPIVASGPNSAWPHATPTQRRLKAREPIILDVGVRVNGYCSDMTRTVFLGSPTTFFRRVYRTVRRAQIAAFKEIRPGVKSNQPDLKAREIISEAGFGEYFGHGLGHGVGLATHERPRLSPLKPSDLKERMVVTVEPGIYVPGRGGVRLEEMVVIEGDGPRILTGNGQFYDFTP